jgi:site-specific DNA-methyltransferase (adenine-specific)
MNRLYYGDNLTVLRDSIADASVDLIYLDPPFNSQATYNALLKGPEGSQSRAQIEAFEDTWHWGDEAQLAFDGVMSGCNTHAAEMLRSLRAFLKENDMMAYLSMMAVRLLELHRVLKPAGTLYLHCDPSASHYLKVLLDAIFGPEFFLNEVIWKRTSGHNSASRWGPVHDVILFYAKSGIHRWNRVAQPYDPEYVKQFYRFKDAQGLFRLGDLTGAGTRTGDSGMAWRDVNPTKVGRHWAVPNKALAALGVANLNGLSTQEKLDRLDRHGLIHWPPKGQMPQFKRYFDPAKGVAAQDVITGIRPLSAQERLGYPTEKPLGLLERIILASSCEGDVVLDPFCGCGTTIHAAQKLQREWVGIDTAQLAISLTEKRLQQAFPGIRYVIQPPC